MKRTPPAPGALFAPLCALAALLAAAALSGCAGSGRSLDLTPPELGAAAADTTAPGPDSIGTRPQAPGPVEDSSAAAAPGPGSEPDSATASPSAQPDSLRATGAWELPEWAEGAAPAAAEGDSAARPPEPEALSEQQMEEILVHAANALRRGARSAEILAELAPLDALATGRGAPAPDQAENPGSGTPADRAPGLPAAPDAARVRPAALPDSLAERLGRLKARIAERDERALSEELARIDSCFRNARVSAARGSMDAFAREHPHLAADPRWLQRLSSLERLEAELEEAELDEAAADRLLAEASGALERGDSEAAVRAARQALRAPDDARRERALALLENSGGRLCAEKRKAASAATAKFQKSKAPEALEEAKNALRTCLELYPETADRAKVERNLRTLEKLR